VTLWLVGAAVCDILITLALSWHLAQQRTGSSHTDMIISRIIQLTVSNGLVTAGFSVADIIAFLSTPRGIHLAFNYTLVKLYGNSMMASLNSRSLLATSNKSYSAGRDISRLSGTGMVHEKGGLRSLSCPPTDARRFFQNTDISGIATGHGRTSARQSQLFVDVETHGLGGASVPKAKDDPEWGGNRYSAGRDSDEKNTAVAY